MSAKESNRASEKRTYICQKEVSKIGARLALTDSALHRHEVHSSSKAAFSASLEIKLFLQQRLPDVNGKCEEA